MKLKCQGFIDVVVYDTKRRRTISRQRAQNKVVTQGLEFLAANIAQQPLTPFLSNYYDCLGAANVGTSGVDTQNSHTNLLAPVYRTNAGPQLYVNSLTERGYPRNIATYTGNGASYQILTVIDRPYPERVLSYWSYGQLDLVGVQIKEVGLYALRATNYFVGGTDVAATNVSKLIARATITPITKNDEQELFMYYYLKFQT
jgi:hypothetical protein